MDVKRVLSHFDFQLSAIFITLRLNVFLDPNSEKTDYLMPSSLFHIHAILKLAPCSPLSIIGENECGAHFLQLYRKNEYGAPHLICYFMILIRTVLPCNEKNIGINICSVFWQFHTIVRIEL